MKEEWQEHTLPEYRSRVFHHMPDWKKFKDLGDSVFYKENQYVAMPGDRVKYCYLLLEGRVISLEITQDGTEHVFNVFDEGAVFLESNVLCDYEVAVYFQTVKPCELIRISKDRLIAAMMEDPRILQSVFDSFASKYYSAMDQLRDLLNQNATWKVYNILLKLADGIGRPYSDDWVMIDMKITLQLLSGLLGLNRITVSKSVKELRESGRIIQVNQNYYCVRKDQL